MGVKPTPGSPDRTPIKTLPLTSRRQSTAQRTKRSLGHVITDCIFVASEEGRYFYKTQRKSEEVCGVYIMTDPDKLVQLYFDYFDVPCQDGGLVSFVDGWEMNGEYFPSPEDHKKPFEDRYHEMCGVKKVKQLFVSSQNAALLQYRLPLRSTGFTFSLRFVKNPNPCNILTEGTTEIYTLRNYGKRVNCSLTALFPGKIKILDLNTGVDSYVNKIHAETGAIYKCMKRGLRDYVQVGGSNGMDTSKLIPVLDVCGLDSQPENYDMTILCGVTTVRLVSSGQYDNSVTVAMRKATDDDVMNTDLICEP